jgi:phage tail-like protein
MALHLGTGTIPIAVALTGDGTEVLRPLASSASIAVLAGTIRRSPRVASAAALDARHIRVTFDQQMLNDSRLADVANYAFVPVGAGVPVFVRSLIVQSATFPLFVDVEVTEMTQGAQYVATVTGGASGPRDRYGFNMNASGLSVLFVGIGEAPVVSQVAAVSANRADVKFSEPITDGAGPREPANYAFNNGLVVLSVLGVVGDTVQLVTADQMPGTLYTLTITTTPPDDILDQALNLLATPAQGQMLGWQEPEAAAEALALRIYMFLIEGIRIEDQQNGQLFVKRYLDGPQSIWDLIQRTIFSVKDLWDITRIPDRFLQYLKRIVGWTPDLDHITGALDDDTLRRLIAASVALWKSRGTEDSLSSIVSLVTGARSRIWNWFDFRWVLDETGLGHEHDGRDPWTISIDDDRTYNFRIVDDGTLNRQLVRDLAKLMRPTGERVEITYLLALDLFQTNGDNAQWTTESGNALPLDVGSGVATLEGTGDSYGAVLNTPGPWTNYVVTTRIKGEYGVGPIDVWGVTFFYQDDQNHYAVYATGGGWALVSFLAGVMTVIADTGGGGWPGPVFADLYYSIRIQASPEAGQTRIIIYIDGTEILNVLDSTWTSGPPGIIRLTKDASLTADEIEVLGLPAESDTVDLNS